jgi:opacity protein-like surface antigen
LDGDVTALSFLVNGYYDIPTGSNFTPFITAGIGLARVDVNDLTVPGLRMAPFNGDDTVLAGQVGAGVSYALNEKLNVDLKYRYFMTDNLEFSRGNTLDGLTSHNVYLGVRYSF